MKADWPGTVQVLMSTYNGEKFLAKQLDSILGQHYGKLEILVRDDGSTDSTVDILKGYAERGCLKYYSGKNIGVTFSFFNLMEHANPDASYYAFSDQDDVWLVNKISRAVTEIQKIEKGKPLEPVLYCSAQQIVDETLKELIPAVRHAFVRPGFGNALVENICTGCTCMINRALMGRIIKSLPQFAIMHDFWLYLAGSCFGTVLYDSRACILYRQHSNNVLGSPVSRIEMVWRRIINFKKHRGMLTRQAEEFNRCYLPNGQKGELLRQLLASKKNIKIRIRLLFSDEIYRQNKVDHLIFKGLLLFGLL